MALNTGNGMRCVLAIALSAAVTFGMSGCTFNLPSVSSVKDDAVEQKVSNDYLLTPGTLTVALDEHAAPLAAKDGEGNLVGYQVDVASALRKTWGSRLHLSIPRLFPMLSRAKPTSLSVPLMRTRVPTLRSNAISCRIRPPFSVSRAQIPRSFRLRCFQKHRGCPRDLCVSGRAQQSGHQGQAENLSEHQRLF